ncbi:MAG: type II toxin-antitoxin system VapC family toxin [Acidobacteriota bacterium]
MSYALDTNVLARSIEASHPMHGIAKQSVGTLLSRGEEIFVLAQNLYEFWAIATRPQKANGLGLTADEARLHLEKFTTVFFLKPDVPAIYNEWKLLVSQHQVLGKPSPDARIAAAMKVHTISHLLTFNTDDFKRFTEITSVNPADIK